ncbi:p64 [Dendrolimus punctatus cypovirus 22]|uniref:p64 n=1 Tax=Dendrolimus punctatus cypovirus 22 TaxID=1577776 RepID=UPI00053F61F2|nr:p64 [Dendrolimus punctatus cypovirus 22]AIY60603.1 p64 [Dendrolimus punctatus cypovirus 22]
MFLCKYSDAAASRNTHVIIISKPTFDEHILPILIQPDLPESITARYNAALLPKTCCKENSWSVFRENDLKAWKDKLTENCIDFKNYRFVANFVKIDSMVRNNNIAKMIFERVGFIVANRTDLNVTNIGVHFPHLMPTGQSQFDKKRIKEFCDTLSNMIAVELAQYKAGRSKTPSRAASVQSSVSKRSEQSNNSTRILDGSIDTIYKRLRDEKAIVPFQYRPISHPPCPGIVQACFYQAICASLPNLFATPNVVYNKIFDFLSSGGMDPTTCIEVLKGDGGGFPFTYFEQAMIVLDTKCDMIITRTGYSDIYVSIGDGSNQIYMKYDMGQDIGVHYQAVEIIKPPPPTPSVSSRSSIKSSTRDLVTKQVFIDEESEHEDEDAPVETFDVPTKHIKTLKAAVKTTSPVRDLTSPDIVVPHEKVDNRSTVVVNQPRELEKQTLIDDDPNVRYHDGLYPVFQPDFSTKYVFSPILAYQQLLLTEIPTLSGAMKFALSYQYRTTIDNLRNMIEILDECENALMTIDSGVCSITTDNDVITIRDYCFTRLNFVENLKRWYELTDRPSLLMIPM